MIIHNVAQGSQEWHELRVGKITSSRLKKLTKSDNLDLMDELIAEQELGYADSDGYINADMQWGIDHEPLAIAEYERITGNKTTVIGMLQSDEIPLLTVSPDRLVGTDGAVEVKCPSTKVHIRYIRQNQLPNEYKEQVWQYFLVHNDLKWLDFVSFDPRLTRKPYWSIRVTREKLQPVLDEAMVRVRKFIDKMEKYREEMFF